MPQIMKPSKTLCNCAYWYSWTNYKKGLKGEKYFMLLVDDYTRMNTIFFLKNKSEDFEKFNIYKEMVENEMD